jgi:simple sugar transport system permease protein
VSARLVNILVPIVTVIVAFAVGGLVMLVTGNDPLDVYKSLWIGAGFDWPFQFLPGDPFGVDPFISEFQIQQTLLNFTPLVLTGLAVGFAFRCGLFNIGGQGQFWVGAISGFYVAERLGGTKGLILGLLAGTLGGALWAGIAGGLKAYRGAHEVISTIMLNWIAIYGGQYLISVGGALADKPSGQPVTKPVPPDAYLPAIWGDPELQAVHAGLLIALGCAVLYYLLLNRTTLGFEVRAVGYNPEAARYGGISVRRSIILAMAISGAFAGLAGVGEVLGVNHSIGGTDIPVSTLGFTGIAVALLGRNSALGIVFSALLFAFLDSGARNLSGDFPPELASSLAGIIQGVIVLLVGAEAVFRWLLSRKRKREDIEAGPTLIQPVTTPGEL